MVPPFADLPADPLASPAPWIALPLLWVGHAALWTTVMNRVYARPLPKPFLRLWRLVTGVVIVAAPLAVWLLAVWPWVALAYAAVCAVAFAWFAVVTAARRLRRPSAVLAERTVVHDLGKSLGEAAIGDGKHAWVVRLRGNDVLRFAVTDYTLRVPTLPPALDGLCVLLVSDLHFHGTPSRAWFDAAFDLLTAHPPPDVLVLAGDYVDTDAHRAWIAPLLGRLKWTECGVAILGNHDKRHGPEVVRDELRALGLVVLGNGWREVTIRGERVVLIGHEGPWFTPPPDLADAPTGPFRLCVSHTPDHAEWAAGHGAGLVLCGHTHGGGIRLPLVGSIFVPCRTARRFDQGVFDVRGAVLVVGRGMNGREPLRFRCTPQAVRLVLRA